MRNLYILTLFFYLTSCGSDKTSNSLPTHQDNKTIDSAKTAIDNKPIKYIEKKTEKTDINFLCDCDSLEFWQGGIQGVATSDSTGVYCMGQCATNLDFDIILFSKNDLKLKDCREWKNKKTERIYDSIQGVEYYVFEIPKTKPVEPENEFDTYEYVYPSEVKVYKKFDEGWYLIKKETVNSFEQLGRLKLNTIFKI